MLDNQPATLREMCPRSCSVERTRENGGNRGMVTQSTQSLTLTTEY